MADLVVIVPSRGRPENARRLAEAWRNTTEYVTHLVLVVDDDDPRVADYRQIYMPPFGQILIEPRRRLGGTLNAVAARWAEYALAIGFMGDDHLPQTAGWDVAVAEELAHLRSGIVYGNDLLQAEKLPTAAFMTSDIIRTLGWMVPPGLVHLYIDNAWLELGRAMGRLRYLPDVVIEHMHPDAGKAPMDDRYAEVNAPAQAASDRAVFEEWRSTGLPAAVAKLREAGLC